MSELQLPDGTVITEGQRIEFVGDVAKLSSIHQFGCAGAIDMLSDSSVKIDLAPDDPHHTEVREVSVEDLQEWYLSWKIDISRE